MAFIASERECPTDIASTIKSRPQDKYVYKEPRHTTHVSFDPHDSITTWTVHCKQNKLYALTTSASSGPFGSFGQLRLASAGGEPQSASNPTSTPSCPSPPPPPRKPVENSSEIRGYGPLFTFHVMSVSTSYYV